MKLSKAARAEFSELSKEGRKSFQKAVQVGLISSLSEAYEKVTIYHS